MPYIIPVLLCITHKHIITHQHIVFILFIYLFFHNFFAWTMLISHIIQVLLCITHQLIFIFHFFSSTHFPPLWMVDAMFILIKVFISSYFRSVWHPFSCFILRIVYFVLFCVTSLGPSHFPSCSSHTVHTFFL